MKKHLLYFGAGIALIALSIVFSKSKDDLNISISSGYIHIPFWVFMFFEFGLIFIIIYHYMGKNNSFYDIKDGTIFSIVQIMPSSEKDKNYIVTIDISSKNNGYYTIPFSKKLFGNENPKIGDYKKENGMLVKIPKK